MSKWERDPVSGFVALGSNGEYVSLGESEAAQFVSVVSKCAHKQGRPLIAGAGCESTTTTIRRCQVLSEAGADALLVITPHYYSHFLSEERFRAHFVAVADKSPKPVIIYNVPFYSHVNLSLECIVTLSQHPNIIAIKDNSLDMPRMAEIVQLTRENNFSVLVGSGNYFLPALKAGAVGCIAAVANVLSDQLSNLQTCYERGEMAEANEMHQKLQLPNQLLTRKYGVAGVKYAMALRGFKPGSVRSPLTDIEPKSEAAREIESCLGDLLL